MHATQPRTRRTRRSAVLIATFTLMASALTLVATPTAVVAEELPTVQALQSQELVFRATVDADGTAVARKAYKAKTTGRHLFIVKWSGDAHLKVFILDMNGDVIAKKGNESQPKKVWANLEAGEKYKIKVKAASGTATFNAVVRAPESDVGAYFNDMPEWSDVYTDHIEFIDDIGDGWSDWELEGEQFCRTRTHDLTSTAEEIVTFGIADSWLYPGVLLQGERFAEGITEIQQLPIRQREAADVFVNFLDGDITRTVNDPTPANLAEAVGDIVEEANDANYEPSTSIFFTETQTHSADQMALELGLSARYMKGGIKTKLEMARTETQTTITVYFKEAVFTAAMTQPAFPSEFFSPDLTEATLLQHIDQLRLDDVTNLPLYVDSVTYGRILVFSLTSSEELTEIRAALEAFYDGAVDLEGSVKTAWTDFVASSQRRIVTVGGDSADALAAITSGDFAAYFNSEPELTEYSPISYVIKDLKGEIAYVEETEDYTERECTDAMVNVTVDGMFLENAQDNDGRDEIDLFWVEARAFHEPGAPVFEGDHVCWLADEIEGDNYEAIECWDDEPGSVGVNQGEFWQHADAAGNLWVLPIGFNDLDDAQIMFRAGYQDDDDPGADDWTRGLSGWLYGAEILQDTLPDDGDDETWWDDSTYRFQVNNNGAIWWVYLTIELDVPN